MKSLLLFILFAPSAFSQGVLFEKGITSLSGSYTFFVNDYSSSNGGTAVFSFRGIVDLGFGFSKSVSDDSRIETTSFMPSLTYTIRQNERPGGVILKLGYLSAEAVVPRLVFSGSGIRERNIKISGPVLGAGAGIPFYSNENLAVLAIMGISYGFLSADEGDVDNARSLSLEIAVRPVIGKIGLFFSPGVSVNLNDTQDNAFSFGISIGIIYNLLDNRQNQISQDNY